MLWWLQVPHDAVSSQVHDMEAVRGQLQQLLTLSERNIHGITYTVMFSCYWALNWRTQSSVLTVLLLLRILYASACELYFLAGCRTKRL